VAELWRVTRPGGIAVVFEHNPSNLLTRRVVSNCIFDEGVTLLPHHETESLMRNEYFDFSPSRFFLLLPFQIAAWRSVLHLRNGEIRGSGASNPITRRTLHIDGDEAIGCWASDLFFNVIQLTPCTVRRK
jgi:hypothetical protein